MKEFITIGKISKNCKSSIIYCGDYSSNETTECTYNIINNKISAFDSDFSCESEEEIFRPNSKALNELSNNIKSYGMDLSTNSIYNAYNLNNSDHSYNSYNSYNYHSSYNSYNSYNYYNSNNKAQGSTI